MLDDSVSSVGSSGQSATSMMGATVHSDPSDGAKMETSLLIAVATGQLGFPITGGLNSDAVAFSHPQFGVSRVLMGSSSGSSGAGSEGLIAVPNVSKGSSACTTLGGGSVVVLIPSRLARKEVRFVHHLGGEIVNCTVGICTVREGSVDKLNAAVGKG